MSLDFDVSRMKNYEVLTTIVEKNEDPAADSGAKWHPVTNALIFGAMAIGISSITEDNWEQFYQRMNMWERTNGAQLWRGDLDRDDHKNFITPLEVFMHIGLGTNVSKKTDAEFLKHCFSNVKDNCSYHTEKVPEQYAALGLETIMKDEWQEVWAIDNRSKEGPLKAYDTGFLVSSYKKDKEPVA